MKSLHDYVGEERAARKRMQRKEHAWGELLAERYIAWIQALKRLEHEQIRRWPRVKRPDPAKYARVHFDVCARIQTRYNQRTTR